MHIESAAIDPALRCPEPDERPDLWPRQTTRTDEGTLVIGGVEASSLAEDTPVYLWDTTDFAGRARKWKAAMDEAFGCGYGLSGAQVHYAAKAFMCVRAARLAAEAGLGIDTASEAELVAALSAGVEPGLIGLHGNNKSVGEIDRAIEAGIGRIIVDSLSEIDLVAARARELGAREVPLMVRVTSGVHAGGHDYIATAHEDQKFGLALSGPARDAAQAIAADPHLRLVGLHSHIGSQIFSLDGFAEAAARLLDLLADLAAEGIAVPEVDLGGGYGIAYTGADPVPPGPNEIANELARAVKEAADARGIAVPRISIEPGRSIAGPSQVMLYTVGTIKRQPIGEGLTRTYVSIEGGMSDNIRPALYGAAYTATLANRRPAGPWERCRVVGKHCESGDIVVHDVILPADIRRGDLLAVPAVGAYGHSMASNYNMAARPGVLEVAAGEWGWVVRPETIEDVLARDVEAHA